MSNLRDRVNRLERAAGGPGDSPYCQCGGYAWEIEVGQSTPARPQPAWGLHTNIHPQFWPLSPPANLAKNTLATLVLVAPICYTGHIGKSLRRVQRPGSRPR